jgi:hypothetical protein
MTDLYKRVRRERSEKEYFIYESKSKRQSVGIGKSPAHEEVEGGVEEKSQDMFYCPEQNANSEDMISIHDVGSGSDTWNLVKSRCV